VVRRIAGQWSRWIFAELTNKRGSKRLSEVWLAISLNCMVKFCSLASIYLPYTASASMGRGFIDAIILAYLVRCSTPVTYVRNVGLCVKSTGPIRQCCFAACSTAMKKYLTNKISHVFWLQLRNFLAVWKVFKKFYNYEEFINFYRAKLRVARYCQGKLYVRPSVTLRYRYHIG